MAQARFHSLRGEKSALIGVRANAFTFGWTHVYVPAAACQGKAEGDIFEIPDGYKIVDMVDSDGNIRTTKDGEVLKVLAY